MKLQIVICVIVMALAIMAGGSRAAVPVLNDDGWSQEVNGLQSRLTLVEEGKLYGTRWLVTYLELRNVRDLGNRMEVNCDHRHLKVELLNDKGEPVQHNDAKNRSGAIPDINTIILPWHSSILISLECNNWGLKRDAPATISTDTDVWFIQESERGKVFLRATLTGEKIEPAWKTWSGTLQTPLVKVDWK